MINSLFILNSSGVIIIEKHWADSTPRTVCDFFWDEVRKHARKEDVPPVITAPKHFLINVFRSSLFLVASVNREAPPLFVLEFLHRVLDVFVSYFGDVDEMVVKRNFSTVYQLLEELADNGFPLITEPNALNSLIAPPSVGRRVVEFVTGKSRVSDTIGTAAMSVIPWRKSDVRHLQNEIFFDILEELDCIIDTNGAVLKNDVRGTIQVRCLLSGTPDLTLVLSDSRAIEDVSFHPCVRHGLFEREKVVSFVPPDGEFKLLEYRTPESAHNAPIYLRPEVKLAGTAGTFSFTLGAKPMAAKRATVESSIAAAVSSIPIDDIVAVIHVMPLIATIEWTSNFGLVTYDPKTAELTWNVGRYPPDKTPLLTGKFTVPPPPETAATGAGAGAGAGGLPPTPPSVVPPGWCADVHFTMANTNFSGLAVRDLRLSGEGYKFFRAVRSFLKAGKFVVRI